MSNCTPPLDPGIAIVLLAAGAAERFGGDKLRARCGGRPLVRWATHAAEQAGFTTRLIVVPAAHEPFDQAPHGWQLVENPAPEEGLASSIRAGVRAAKAAKRLVIALADMPLVEPNHLRELALAEGALFTAHPGGRPGVPAGFPASAFPQLLALTGDRGAAALARTIDHATRAPASLKSLVDVDTPKALAEVSARLAALGG